MAQAGAGGSVTFSHTSAKFEPQGRRAWLSAARVSSQHGVLERARAVRALRGVGYAVFGEVDGNMWRRLTRSLIALALPATITATAQAFCRSTSCELGEEDRLMMSLSGCARDEHGCATEGAPLHWPSPCLRYAVQQDGSADEGIDAQTLQLLVQEAFEVWGNAQCPGGGTPRFQAQFQGYVSCSRRESVCADASRNVNLVLFRDHDWEGSSIEIALTTPNGGTTSGLLVDADLQLNSEDFDFTLDSSTTNAFALREVLAHEVGHFLGLAHSDVSGALMSTSYESLQLSSELLTNDDIAAICATYPPGAPLSCSEPPPPAYDECQISPGPTPPCVLASMTHDRKGCSFVASHGDSDHGVAALGLGALFLLRRRQQTRSAPRPARCA
jgi:MYXO-CTERM domain-containing protein